MGHDHHNHAHSAASEDAQSYIEANRTEYGSEKLEAIAGPLLTWMSVKSLEAVLTKYDFDKNTTTVLDFACGSGVIAHRLRENCKKVVGVDLSQTMVDAFNQQAEKSGLDKTTIHAVQKEALRDADDELDGELFDVVLCSQAYHHVPDLKHLTKSLARRLKVGGKLIVVEIDSNSDFRKVSETSSDLDKVIPHKLGFSAEDLRSLFEGAGGLIDVKIDPAHETTFGEMRALGGPHNMAANAPYPDGSTMKWIVATGVRGQ